MGTVDTTTKAWFYSFIRSALSAATWQQAENREFADAVRPHDPELAALLDKNYDAYAAAILYVRKRYGEPHGDGR